MVVCLGIKLKLIKKMWDKIDTQDFETKLKHDQSLGTKLVILPKLYYFCFLSFPSKKSTFIY